VSPRLAFNLSVLLGFIAWGIVAREYIWPALRGRRRADALRPILMLHAFRFVGLSFIVPGVVSTDLPVSFAGPAAYGDFATAILALLSIALLRTPFAVVLVWAFNVLGTADLLHAVYEGIRLDFAPGLQGAAYFIPVALVPLLLVTHGLTFRLLLQRDRAWIESAAVVREGLFERAAPDQKRTAG
jgi:hypothetical protein